MRPAMFLMWLTGCAGAVSDCPPLRHYDQATQTAMAAELSDMERQSLYPFTRRAMVDYAGLRAVIQACQGAFPTRS